MNNDNTTTDYWQQLLAQFRWQLFITIKYPTWITDRKIEKNCIELSRQIAKNSNTITKIFWVSQNKNSPKGKIRKTSHCHILIGARDRISEQQDLSPLSNWTQIKIQKIQGDTDRQNIIRYLIRKHMEYMKGTSILNWGNYGMSALKGLRRYCLKPAPMELETGNRIQEHRRQRNG